MHRIQHPAFWWCWACPTWLKHMVIGGVFMIALSGCSMRIQARTPASWETQISLAAQAVRNIDTDAILVDVLARPERFQDARKSTSLGVRMRFLRSNGHVLVVEYNDVQPFTTLRVTDIGDDGPVLAPELRQRLREAVAQIQVSPQEALQQTQAVGQTLTDQMHAAVYDPTVGLDMGPVVEQNLGVLAAWGVLYEGEVEPGVPISFRVWVDPQTGDILKVVTNGTLYGET